MTTIYSYRIYHAVCDICWNYTSLKKPVSGVARRCNLGTPDIVNEITVRKSAVNKYSILIA